MNRFFYLCLLTVFAVVACGRFNQSSPMSGEEAKAIMDDVRQRNLAYVPLTEQDDTLMQRVVAYYKKHGTANERMEAYYLMGSVRRDLHDAPKALEAYMNGIAEADTSRADLRYDILARLYGQACDIMYIQSLHRQSYEAERMVHKYAVLARDTMLIVASRWGLLDRVYAWGDYQTIADGCWEALEESKRLGRLSVGARYLCTSVLANVEVGRLEDAARLLSVYEQHSGYVDTETYDSSFPIYYYAKGRVLAAFGKTDSAEYFFRRELTAADWNNREAAYRGLRQVFEQRGKTDSVCKYASLQCEAVDSSYHEKLSQSLQELYELYDYNRLQAEAGRKELLLKESQQRNVLAACVLAVVCLCAVFTLFYLRTRYRQRIASAELKLERAESELKEREDNLATLRKELAKEVSEKERLRLAQEVEEAERETRRQQDIVMKSQERVDALRRRRGSNTKSRRQKYCQTELFQYLIQAARTNRAVSEDDYERLYRFFTRREGALLTRFTGILPNHSKVELHTFLLLRLGLTKTEVGLLTARTQAAVTNTCTRMFQKANGRKCLDSNEAYEWLLNL